MDLLKPSANDMITWVFSKLSKEEEEVGYVV